MPSTPQDHKPSKKKKKGKKRSGDRPLPTQQESPDSKYAPTAWLAGSVGSLHDLVVPATGQRCLVRRPGMEGLMQAGILHNVDTLSKVVADKHLKDGGKQVDVASLSQDTEAIAAVSHVVDRVVSYCVVKPEVYMAPNDKTSREPGVVYTDMIDLVDKFFIFNFVVGGTRDMESFRGGLLEPVGSVESGEGVSMPTQ